MTFSAAHTDPASFRDPAGRVYKVDGRIFHTVTEAGRVAFEAVWEAGILHKMAEKKLLINSRLLSADDPVCSALSTSSAYTLEHPVLPMISYPYEWSFAMLKSAALAHLDLQLALLEDGFILSDASAFNMQFDGAQPLHIDALSLISYQEGMLWGGYRQFLHHFLNPLLLEAKTGVSFASFFRATLDGISSDDLLRLLPLRSVISPALFAHVVVPAWGERHFSAQKSTSAASPRALSKARYRSLLQHLRNIIQTLKPHHSRSSQWDGYTATTSYAAPEAEAKQQVFIDFVRAQQPSLLLDIGCNTGEYAALALENGAKRVVGVDADRASVDMAFERSSHKNCAFTPLVVDMANPSPTQGWRGIERAAFDARVQAEAVVALALIHHLCIGKNIPLSEVVECIVSLAPHGLIEFVPKSDPQVVELLRFRQDIFPDYNEETFKLHLSRCAHIVDEKTIGESGRVLFQFERGQ